MAKSLRSKRRRKMRAIKRERYGKKELAQLKKILGIEDEKGDAEMKNITNIATVVEAKSIQANTSDILEEKVVPEAKSILANTSDILEENVVPEKILVQGEKEISANELMDVDEIKRKYSKKTLRDEHGNYPVWMSLREVKKRSKVNRQKKKLRRKRIQDKPRNKN